MSDEISSDAWYQDGLGAAVDGQPEPMLRQSVAVAGVVQVRDTPTLAAVTSAIPAAQAGEVYHLIGAAPQRRRVIVSSSVDVIVATDRGTAQAGIGLLIPARVPVALHAAVDLYVQVQGTDPGMVTCWGEVDFG